MDDRFLEVMRKNHPYWKEFIIYLKKKLGEVGCDGTLRHTMAILEKMNLFGEDQEASIGHLKVIINGDYTCDCDVLNSNYDNPAERVDKCKFWRN